MPTFFGYGFHLGGYTEYLNGKERFAYLKKGKYDPLAEHSLEKVDEQVKPDEGTNEVAGYSSGTPVNQSVSNEICIEDRSREQQRLVGLTNSMPVSMDLKGGGKRAIVSNTGSLQPDKAPTKKKSGPKMKISKQEPNTGY